MENLPENLQIRGLMQGSSLPLKQVKQEICPECPYRTAFCELLMRIHMDGLADKGLSIAVENVPLLAA
jgi:hypothetical protein